MVNSKKLLRPDFQFLALGVCLLLLGILTFHSDWPPERWVPTYFVENDVGIVILLYSGLFFTFSLAYFLLPKMFHRQTNAMLSQIHFWLNVIAFLVQLALPIYFNLFLERPKDTFGGLDRAFDPFFLGIKVLAVVQILFLANVFWSVFKGGRTSHPTSPTSNSVTEKV